MWECPKCKKIFKKLNQNHFCEKSANIDDYIAKQDESIRPILQKVRETIREALPDATEKIAWNMPTFWMGENIIHFCAHKNHLGLHPGLHDENPFQERLIGYKYNKGSIHFPYDKSIDYDLIADIVRWRVKCL